MCGLQWLHLFEEKRYWCPCVHIAPWFWPRQEHFLVPASSLTIWTSSFLYFVWTWGSISSERSDYELILLQHEEHYLYIQASCSFPHMAHNSHVFYIEHRLPLLYTCSFTQRPKPSGGKGAKSLLKRQRDSAFVSEWAHLRRRKRDWQSLRTRTIALVVQTVSHTYTELLCRSFPVNDPWSGGHQGIGMSLWNPLLTGRHSCTSFTKNAFKLFY